VRVGRPAIAALIATALCAAALAAQTRPAAQAADAATPVAPYRVGYTSQDTTELMASTPGVGTESSVLGEAGGVDFDASAGGPAATGSTGLVWVSNRTAAPGAAGHTGQIFYQPRGGSAVRLTDNGAVDQYPALSPDGRQVAFAAQQTGAPGVLNIWVVGVDGTGLRQVTTDTVVDTWPSWSPDGTKLAFSSTRDDPAGEIYTVPVAGGAETRITTDPAADTEPAWSPDGSRIAFTTTRFHTTGDVALVAATGGTVTRVMPNDTGDTSEPAWSADGSRIAFTTHRDNRPLGEIDQVALGSGAISVVASDNGLGDTHPTWLRTVGDGRAIDQVVFTQLRYGGSDGIFSADAAGNDRHDLTGNPGIEDSDPAFTTDGTKLAYTEQNGEDASRVVVASSDGSNPHPLTGDPAGAGSQSNPAWSPDGTEIALSLAVDTDEQITNTVQIVRVADGQVIGSVPAPPGMAASDVQPTWSPDGTRIALERTGSVNPTEPSQVNPATVNRAGAAGSSFDVNGVTVETPNVPANPDVLFLVDATGSMGEQGTDSESPIAGVETNMASVVSQIQAQQPNANFGLATYRDLDFDGIASGFGVAQPLESLNTSATLNDFIQNKIGGIDATGGGDLPEDWLYALHQAATGSVSWRPNSTKLVVLIGDAYSHDLSPDPNPDEPPLPEGTSPADVPRYSLPDAISALQAAGIRVIAVPVSDSANNHDTCLGLDAPEADPEHTCTVAPDAPLDGSASKHQATAVAGATNGTVTASSHAGDIDAAISQAISSLPVTVNPVTHCDAGLSVSFSPTGPQTVPGGQQAKFTESVAVDPNAPIGSTLNCTVDYLLDGENTVRPGYTQAITVEVRDPASPVVIVSPVATNATGAAGAVIDYAATATDFAGNPLPTPPSCTPPSGSTFPVGVTTVTCTATDANGNTGTSTATMTVYPTAPGTPSIWVASLAPQPDGTVAVTNQVDLSVKFGDPCSGGPDQAPDWSPDGNSLAFSHIGHICVADITGDNARRVDQNVNEESFFTDPAWSPDGKLVAFADGTLSEVVPQVWTVPAAGGTPTALITTPGGASQPAFQRQPDLGVTATANPTSVAFDARSTLTFTVANHGSVPAPNTRLQLTLPAGLRAEQITSALGGCEVANLACVFGTMAPNSTATVRLLVTGVQAGAQTAVAAIHSDLADANPGDDTATVTVTVAKQIVVTPPPPGKGDLSLLTGVGPNTGFVGGDDIVVTYTVHNAAPVAMPAVVLTTSLPAALGPPKTVSPATCDATGTGCQLGTLAPGQTVQVRYTLAALIALRANESGAIATTGPDTVANDNTATAAITIIQPVLTIGPAIGPPGFVTQATGTGFPPGAVIVLTWSAGISPTPGQVTVRPDGTFAAQVLIFHHDQLGQRVLQARTISGPAFGPVSSPPFLVVPSGAEPPLFGGPN
jgi:Tol biopolymer transport system component